MNTELKIEYYLSQLDRELQSLTVSERAEIVTEIARHAAETGHTSLALVAVNDSTGFWRRQGFREVHDPALDRKLASYDDAARYMRRELTN